MDFKQLQHMLRFNMQRRLVLCVLRRFGFLHCPWIWVFAPMLIPAIVICTLSTIKTIKESTEEQPTDPK